MGSFCTKRVRYLFLYSTTSTAKAQGESRSRRSRHDRLRRGGRPRSRGRNASFFRAATAVTNSQSGSVASRRWVRRWAPKTESMRLWRTRYNPDVRRLCRRGPLSVLIAPLAGTVTPDVGAGRSIAGRRPDFWFVVAGLGGLAGEGGWRPKKGKYWSGGGARERKKAALGREGSAKRRGPGDAATQGHSGASRGAPTPPARSPQRAGCSRLTFSSTGPCWLRAALGPARQERNTAAREDGRRRGRPSRRRGPRLRSPRPGPVPSVGPRRRFQAIPPQGPLELGGRRRPGHQRRDSADTHSPRFCLFSAGGTISQPSTQSATKVTRARFARLRQPQRRGSPPALTVRGMYRRHLSFQCAPGPRHNGTPNVGSFDRDRGVAIPNKGVK